MPYYSELGLYTSPILASSSSSNSGVYLAGPYSNHSSLLSTNFSRPPPIVLKNRPFRTYKPPLATITENHHHLRRVNSPKLLLKSVISSGNAAVPIARPIKINTADIDVSVNKYRKYDRQNRQQPHQQQKDANDKITTPPESPRNSEEKEAKPNKTIRRDRATIRIQTIHKDMLANKLSQTDNNNNNSGNRRWRDNFDLHELYDVSSKPKERKTAGELLKEKFLIKDEQASEPPPPPPQKNALGKSPSFHDICQAITTNRIDEELNPGQPIEIQRRQSRQISTEGVLNELKRSSVQLDDHLVAGADGDDADDGGSKDYDSRSSVRKKKKLAGNGNNNIKTSLQRRSTKKKLRKLSKDLVKDISQVEIERIDRKPKPIITATVNIDETIEDRPAVNLKAIVDDVEIEESPLPQKKNRFKFNVIVEEIEEPKLVQQKDEGAAVTDRKIEEIEKAEQPQKPAACVEESSKENDQKAEENAAKSKEIARKIEETRKVIAEKAAKLEQLKNSDSNKQIDNHTATETKIATENNKVNEADTQIINDKKISEVQNEEIKEAKNRRPNNSEIKKSTSCEKLATPNRQTEEECLIKKSKSDDKLSAGSRKIPTISDLKQIKQVVDKRMAKIAEDNDDNSKEDDKNFWDDIGARESVYKAPNKPLKLPRKLELKPKESETQPQSPQPPKPLPSKRSLVNKANKDDPDLEVFNPPTPPPEPEPEPEPQKDVFVPLQSNRISQFMHPFKKPEQLDVCPVEIYAKPKTIRKRHYPRPRHQPPPPPETQPEDSSADETSEDESSSSTEDEYDVTVADGNKIGASTSSNDSGFDSGVRRSRDKGSCETRDGTISTNPTMAIQQNPAFSLDEEFCNSSTFASFQKSGRITPPATTIPRFRKYTLDDFNFLKVLGKGSFGKVLLAELKNTEYYYAVKCLKKDVVLEDDDVECTLIERKVLALGTKHPYLCHLLCTFQTESHLFFVMEYLNGGDLMFHIQQSGRFPEYRAKFYGAEIVSGLKFLHNKGIVYRDLKLDNILLDFDGHVRIADFGMCKLQIFLDRMADTFCGTPDYMAPEIIKGQHYNQCVDWWSFGVLLYEMLLGQSPFSGCDEDELFWSICNEKPVIPRFLTAEASAILLLLLEKDANKRLGNRFCPAGDIQDQPFFRQIDWDKLEARQLEAPFKPNLQHPLDTQYFDRTFTVEKAKLTPTETNILQSMDQTQFQGFSYTNPNATDK